MLDDNDDGSNADGSGIGVLRWIGDDRRPKSPTPKKTPKNVILTLLVFTTLRALFL